jgi:hypothetical protein
VDQLVELIGAADGAERPFEEWRMAAIQAGLQPNKIQNLKRRGLVWTRIAEDGTHFIVRGARPAPEPT